MIAKICKVLFVFCFMSNVLLGMKRKGDVLSVQHKKQKSEQSLIIEVFQAIDKERNDRAEEFKPVRRDTFDLSLLIDTKNINKAARYTQEIQDLYERGLKIVSSDNFSIEGIHPHGVAHLLAIRCYGQETLEKHEFCHQFEAKRLESKGFLSPQDSFIWNTDNEFKTISFYNEMDKGEKKEEVLKIKKIIDGFTKEYDLEQQLNAALLKKSNNAINQKNNHGRTALHILAQEHIKWTQVHYEEIDSWLIHRRNIDLASLLLAMGANPNILTSNGNMPLNFCYYPDTNENRASRNVPMACLLLLRGAHYTKDQGTLKNTCEKLELNFAHCRQLGEKSFARKIEVSKENGEVCFKDVCFREDELLLFLKSSGSTNILNFVLNAQKNNGTALKSDVIEESKLYANNAIEYTHSLLDIPFHSET